MRPATVLGSSAKLARRQLLLGALALAMALVGLGLLVAALSTGGGDVTLNLPGSGAKSAGSGPTIVALGSGRATAPAETASLQFVIVPRARDFGGGSSISSPPPGATPGTTETDAAQPVVDAVVAAGATRADVRLTASAALSVTTYGFASQFGVRLDVAVRRPTIDGLNKIVNAAGEAASENGLIVQQVGAGYAVADCTQLARQARQAAIEDARARAQEQAELLNVGLGKLLVASDASAANAGSGSSTAADVPGGGCAAARSVDNVPAGSRVGTTLPAFDPTLPPEATALAQVGLTFAIGS